MGLTVGSSELSLQNLIAILTLFMLIAGTFLRNNWQIRSSSIKHQQQIEQIYTELIELRSQIKQVDATKLNISMCAEIHKNSEKDARLIRNEIDTIRKEMRENHSEVIKILLKKS